ncbi:MULTISPECIES: WXG100-like domain-containing protein [Catenuloplanes]|uniref:Outer membrane channel protein CpnT-like N-terminal domain-containing protein n=1 Tax=Catenuloplanes niger TaxID=587534 RepID=A0AAE3ZYH2_9ACTN|nr:hypothetical protein [Catenuloplanes niger]MDR7328308.1 hypothetical protein [Catenuloplanes niger]
MSLQLPGELISLLGVLGYTWPEADEDRLFEMGQTWISFSTTINEIVGDANTGAGTVWAENSGQDIAAFQAWWTKDGSPADALTDGATAAVLTGTGLIVCGTIVLALKIAVIVQLTILAIQIAQAVATAAVTFGASLLEIPVFQALARTVIGNLIQEVVLTLLEG